MNKHQNILADPRYPKYNPTAPMLNCKCGNSEWVRAPVPGGTLEPMCRECYLKSVNKQHLI